MSIQRKPQKSPPVLAPIVIAVGQFDGEIANTALSNHTPPSPSTAVTDDNHSGKKVFIMS